MKFATIGTSWITDSFIKSSGYIPSAEIIAVYSRSIEKAQKFAREENVPCFYDSLEEMLENKEIEAVYIASPNVAHFAQAKMCLEYGKHVICDKPVCTSLSELDEIEALSKENRENRVLLAAAKPKEQELARVKLRLLELDRLKTALSQEQNAHGILTAGQSQLLAGG